MTKPPNLRAGHRTRTRSLLAVMIMCIWASAKSRHHMPRPCRRAHEEQELQMPTATLEEWAEVKTRVGGPR